MNMAGSKRQLDQAVAQTRGILQTRSCALIPLDFQQEKGLTACLPLGINPLKIERCMPTSAVAGFIPFSTQELCRLDGKPVYYGINREPKSERVDLRHIRQRQVRFRQAGDDLHLSDHG